jgi:hypothetical protein
MRIRHIILTFLILGFISGCVTTNELTFKEAVTFHDSHASKRDFLILYNNNNQYELHNYTFHPDYLEGVLYVPKVDRSNGLMVYTDASFAIVDTLSANNFKIPIDRISRIEYVKTDAFKSIAFVACVTLLTLSFVWAGTLFLGGML